MADFAGEGFDPTVLVGEGPNDPHPGEGIESIPSSAATVTTGLQLVAGLELVPGLELEP